MTESADGFINDLAMQIRKINKITEWQELIDKGPAMGERGWLVPYMLVCDEAYTGNRWGWWTKAITDGHLPDTPIPQIEFLSNANERGEALKHLHKLLDYLSSKGHPWNGLEYLLDEILWGLGQYRGLEMKVSLTPPKELWEGSREWFMKNFGLHLLQQHPYDYWADIISESRGGGWNPNAFYPTPMPLVELMVKMQFGTDREWKEMAVQSVHDPCCGTGRFTLFASNYSLQHAVQDIDLLVLKSALVNFTLYAPWVIVPGDGKVKEIDEHNLVANNCEAKPMFTFDKSGQGRLI